ncbi:MAG TPA: hypothetical protein VFV50_12275 [Bdellovibrionales bacterium]|nr:hypothetical protein [Bdellovibrionales bacterium]
MRFGWILPIFVLIFVAQRAAADPVVVEWRCPQTRGGELDSRELPDEAQVTIDVKPNGQVTLAAAERFLAPARRARTDYFSCMMEFRNAVTLAVSSYCARSANPRCDDNSAEWLQPFQESIRVAGREARAGALLPQLVPMSELESKPPSTDLMIEQCVTRFSPELSKKFLTADVPAMLEKMEPGCQRKFLASLLEDLANRYAATPACNVTPELAACKELFARYEAALRQIESLVNARIGTANRGGFNDAINCFSRATDKAEALRNILSELKKVNACYPPALTRPETYGPRGDGQPRDYALTRIGEKDYVIDLRIAFERGMSFAGERFDPATLEREINACLPKINAGLRFPGGETIRLQLNDPEVKFSSMVTPQNVAVESPDFRSNTSQFASKIDCETIAHELFHYMGLADEYPETSMGYVRGADGKPVLVASGAPALAFDCRANGPEDSIMRNPWLAFKSLRERRQPLLKPYQLNVLLFPECDTKNSNYRACAQNAMRTSKMNQGGGCVPSACTGYR